LARSSTADGACKAKLREILAELDDDCLRLSASAASELRQELASHSTPYWEDGEVRGWILPGSEPGISYRHADLLRAAAEEPVVEGPEGQPVFIAGPFRQRLLENVASKARA